MALKDLLAKIDHNLAEIFHTVKYDPTKDRAKFAKRVLDTKTKFESGSSKGRKDYSVDNGVVAYRPTYNDHAIDIADLSENEFKAAFIKVEQFPSALDDLVDAVNQGELDDQLEMARAPATFKLTSHMKTRVGSDVRSVRADGSSTREWSQERRDRYNASSAARKAAETK